MSATRTMGVSVTDVGTEQVLPLGFVFHEPASAEDNSGTMEYWGERHWVYVKNAGASDLTVGLVALSNGAATPFEVKKCDVSAAVKHRIPGVAQHTIAAGSYGFILAKGKGTASTDGTLAANEIITSKSDGLCKEMGSAEEAGIIGMALVTDGGGAALRNAIFDCYAG